LPVEAESRIVFSPAAEIIYHRATAAGGLTTTLTDLLQFAKFIQNRGVVDGREILSPAPFRKMLGEHPGSESFGISVGTNRGERYWYAGGDPGGYHTVLLWFPKHRRALLTMAASNSNMATWNLVPKVMESWFGPEVKSPPAPLPQTLPNALEIAARVAGTYRPVRYPHHDIGKTFVITMDQSVRANADGSITFAGERWTAVDPLRFRNVNDGRSLTFELGPNGRVRFLNRASERIEWYETGRVAIASYFGFLLLSGGILWRTRHRENVRPLRWVAWAILIHGVAWLGAILLAEPQRLILGAPWYLTFATSIGTIVPVAWLYLVVTIFLNRPATLPEAFRQLSLALLLGSYIPFKFYWHI